MQRGKARGKGVGSLEEESWEYPTGEALTESYPKRLRIELLGGLLGFTDWVRVARAPGGGRRKSRGKRGPPPAPNSPARVPVPTPTRVWLPPDPKSAPAVARPNSVISPRTLGRSNRSSPAKCRSCSKGGARVGPAGAAALAISVDGLRPTDKSRHSSCQCRTAAATLLPGVAGPGSFPATTRPIQPQPRLLQPGHLPSRTLLPRLEAQLQTSGPVGVVSYSSFIYLIG